MTALSDIREGLAEALTNAFGADVQVSGYVLSQPQPPFFDIELANDAIAFDQAAARGLDLWRFTVRGCVDYNLDLQAQKQLDEWAAASGDASVKAALEADLSLGGRVEALHVTDMSGYRQVANNAPTAQPSNVYLAADWTVEVYARG
jgi:hypothetical protein